MDNLSVVMNNILKFVLIGIGILLLLFFGPGIVKGIYEVGKEVGQAISYWV